MTNRRKDIQLFRKVFLITEESNKKIYNFRRSRHLRQSRRQTDK